MAEHDNSSEKIPDTLFVSVTLQFELMGHS